MTGSFRNDVPTPSRQALRPLVISLSLLVISLSLGCARKPAEAWAAIEVRVKTQLNRPLEGVFVRAGQHRSITDDQGVAEFLLPGDKNIRVEAGCPAEMDGKKLRREFSPGILAGGARFSIELVCREAPPMQTLAVFAEGCGEVEVFVDERSIGITQDGWLHEERAPKLGNTTRLRVEPTEGTCQFETGPERQLELTAARPGAWIRVWGQRPPMRSLSPNRRKEEDEPRPYRL